MVRHGRQHRWPATETEQVSADALRRALSKDELTAQFQPIVSTGDGGVVGLEALVRWRRADGRLVGAGAFLDAAASAGLLPQVDHRTMGIVARELVRAELPRDLRWISVNVAPASLLEREVTRRAVELAEELERFDLRLVLEIAERSMDPAPVEVTATLDAFRRSGLQVALDDFGRRPCHIDRLLDFPVDVVKIGRRPLVRLRRLSDERGYTRAIVGLCRSLGRSVVVSQVEDPPNRAGSPIAEADFVQGEFFGRPAFLNGTA